MHTSTIHWKIFHQNLSPNHVERRQKIWKKKKKNLKKKKKKKRKKENDGNQ